VSAGSAAGAIWLRQCSKHFGPVKALGPVDLDIPAGQILVLLGPSGCGKTTLLRILAGLEEPDEGAILRIDGSDLLAQAAEERRFGMVFQSYALFPNMNVRQNIAYGLKLRRLRPQLIEARVDAMLDLVAMRDLGLRRIEQLSGGQRQRVALARALAIEPRAVLLDEPLSALDAHLRERLRVEIRDLLKSAGVTAVYVTHDQEEAMALGDRIAVFNHGRIEQVGEPAEVYASPSTAFVAAFFGHVNQLGDLYFRRDQAAVVAAGSGLFDATVLSATPMGAYLALELGTSEGSRITLHRFLAPTLTSSEGYRSSTSGSEAETFRPGQTVGIKVLRRIRFGSGSFASTGETP